MFANVSFDFTLAVAFDQQSQGRGFQFNYDPPSNNGQYTGPSSYEVALGSYTRDF